MKHIIPSINIPDFHIEDIGYKALRLRMAQISSPEGIPNFWCMTGAVCSRLLERDDHFEPLMINLEQLNQDEVNREKIREGILSYISLIEFPEIIEKDLLEILTQCPHLVIRTSSAIAHEPASKKCSFASTLEELKSEILLHIACEVVSRGLPFQGSIIIQQLIQPEISAIVFTANPKTGNRGEAVINAFYGAEIIDSQQDKISFDWQSATISNYEIGLKTRKHLISTDGTTKSEEIPNSNHLERILTEDQLNNLLAHSFRMLRNFSKPLRLHYGLINGQIKLIGIKKPSYFPAMRDSHREASTWSNDNLETSQLYAF